MRLIDADALDWERIEHEHGARHEAVVDCEQMVEKAPTIDAVPIEFIAELFGDVPCNYTFFETTIDEFMYSECGDWCESNCDNVPPVECWKQFIEAWGKSERWKR